MPGAVDVTASVLQLLSSRPAAPGLVSGPSIPLPELLALVLVTAGIVGVLVPKLPGSLASLAGVYLYWAHTGHTEPSTLLLAALTAAGVAALAGTLFASVAADRVSGASTMSALAAAIVGGALFVFVGPGVGLLGVLGTVFLLEYRRSKQLGAASVAALTVVLASVAPKAVRLLLTGAIWLVVVALVVL
ncbi:MAG: DUF456 family protein [Halovenus sp.]